MEYSGKNITVLGLARSGFSSAKLLLSKGARVFISDCDDNEIIRRNAKELEKLGAQVELGEHSDKIFSDADEIILSPGIPKNIPILNRARALKPDISIISEIELGFRFAKADVIGITGSNGKSTTVTLAGEIFKSAGFECYVAGNIGLPFCEVVEKASEKSVICLELSSFQLETVHEFHPRVSCLLNLTPDHLDRYENLEEYYSAKMRIFKEQKSDEFAVLNADDLKVSHIGGRLKSKVLYFSLRNLYVPGCFVKNGFIVQRNLYGTVNNILPVDELGILGSHNLANACAAVSCALPFDLPIEAIAKALREFKGLPHRLEPVGEIRGVKFINDSKATNIDALECSLKSFKTQVVLIAGGYDKGADFRPLRELVKKHAKNVVLIGKTAEKISSDWDGVVSIEKANSFEDAVEKAYNSAFPDGIVLLAPGCASFDMFKNFEDRGEQFAKIVRKMMEKYRA